MAIRVFWIRAVMIQSQLFNDLVRFPFEGGFYNFGSTFTACYATYIRGVDSQLRGHTDVESAENRR